MSVSVDLTYDMGKLLGATSLEVEGASSVSEVVELAQERFGANGEDFSRLARVAAIAINGVLVNHRRGMKTAVRDGDRVGFVKAAAGG